jgi:hypothetical protein
VRTGHVVVTVAVVLLPVHWSFAVTVSVEVKVQALFVGTV